MYKIVICSVSTQGKNILHYVVTFVPALQLSLVYENKNKKEAGAERLPALLVS